MNDEISTLYQAAKALITYIDKEEVFDRAAAGGCSGLDFHQSDTFYDLIVQTREVVAEIENGAKNEVSDEESDKKVRAGEAYSRLFDALKALAAHVEQERAFDKVTDLGPVGFETHQSEAFREVVRTAHEALKEVESRFE